MFYTPPLRRASEHLTNSHTTPLETLNISHQIPPKLLQTGTPTPLAIRVPVSAQKELQPIQSSNSRATSTESHRTKVHWILHPEAAPRGSLFSDQSYATKTCNDLTNTKNQSFPCPNPFSKWGLLGRRDMRQLSRRAVTTP